MMTRLVPKVFFKYVGEGLDLLVDCLGFTVRGLRNLSPVVAAQHTASIVRGGTWAL